MITNRLPKLNVKYIVGEILLIFFSIQISLLFNDWSERQSLKDEEIKFLKELRQNIKIDKQDVERSIDFKLNRAIPADSIVISRIKSGDPNISRPLAFCFMNGGWMEQNRSAYETLKFRGLTIISNDSLRKIITNYYEPLSSELQQIEQEFNNITLEATRILANYAEAYSMADEIKIRNFNALRMDNRVLFYLTMVKDLNEARADYLRSEIQPAIESIITLLNSEIKRLES